MRFRFGKQLILRLRIRVVQVLIEEQQDITSDVPARTAWSETKGDEPPPPLAAAPAAAAAASEGIVQDEAVVEVSSPQVVRSSRLNRESSGEVAELLTPTLPRWVETEPRRDRFSPVGITTDQPIFLPMCPSCLRKIDGKGGKPCLTGTPIVLILKQGLTVEFHPPFPGRFTGLPITQPSPDTLMVANEQRCKVCALYTDTTHPERRCKDCNLRENLWTCMTCAHVGCGRYTDAQHAKKHFHETLHPFCLELATGRIWDYVNDNFVHVHVLVQPNPAQLEMSARDPQELEKGSMSLENELDEVTMTKISNLVKEYDAFLNSQLEQQRLFYEQEIAKARYGLVGMFGMMALRIADPAERG